MKHPQHASCWGHCGLALAGLLLLASCADTYDGDEQFDIGVYGEQMTSPAEENIQITASTDGSKTNIAWKVVYGAGGYACKVYDVSTSDAVLKVDTIVEGCTLTVPREEDTNYRFEILALGNAAKRNTDATTATQVLFSSIVEGYATVPATAADGSVTDLTQWFADNPIAEDAEGELAFDLEGGGSYVMSGPIDLGYHQVLLRTSKVGATITMTDASACFVIQQGFVLKNLRLDCTQSESKGVIVCSETPDERVPLNETIWENAGTKGSYVITDPVSLRNCMVRGLKNAVVAVGNDNGWVVVSLNLFNSIIQLENEKGYFLDFYGSGKSSAFKNLTIQGNTIYNLLANNQQFAIRFGNASNAVKLFGTNSNPENGRFIWNISNNTIMRVMTAKAFGNNLPNNACVTNIMTDNVFIDILQLQKYIQGNQSRTYSHNVIWGIDTNIDSTDKGTYCELDDPGFTPPTEPLDLTQANGGLSLTPTGLALEWGSGDPRWLE